MFQINCSQLACKWCVGDTETSDSIAVCKCTSTNDATTTTPPAAPTSPSSSAAAASNASATTASFNATATISKSTAIYGADYNVITNVDSHAETNGTLAANPTASTTTAAAAAATSTAHKNRATASREN